jgi:hypothetical protein
LLQKDRFAGLANRQGKTKRSLRIAGFHATYFKAVEPYSTGNPACFL